MPSRRIGAGVVALAFAVAVAAVGCTGGGEDEPLRRGSSTTVSGEPVAGGVLRVGIEEPTSLDPSLLAPASQSDLLLADLLFDGLTARDGGARPDADPGVEPALAVSWTPSADLLSWRFVLRPGATFADGAPVTAGDVKFTLERVARRGDVSLAAARLEVVLGYDELVSGSAGELSGVTVFDDATVEIATVEPFADLPLLLASPVFGIVPRAAAVDEATFAAAPVGSGPFRLATATGAGAGGDGVIRLVRATGGSALLDGIELHTFEELGEAYEGFGAGELDVTVVPPERVDDAADRFGDDHFRPFAAELFYGFNLANPKYADARFREAIVRAIDRGALVRAVYGSAALPLAGVVPASVPGHVDDPCGGRCDVDQDRARELVAEVFGGGAVPEVQLDYYESTQEEAVAGIIESSLEAVGIPAARRPRPFEEYQQFATSGAQELFRLGWIGTYVSAGAYVEPLFRSDALDNAIGFADEGVDGLLAAARATVDPVARMAAYRRAEAAVMALTPIVPLLQFRTHVVAAPRVQDLAVSVAGTFSAERIWLSGS